MAADGLSKRARIKVVADDDDKFPTSVHKVLSNDDLLTEILLRLPTLSLHLFKPVCKQWLSIIKSSSFTSTRTRIPNVDPPTGLLIGRYCEDWGPNDYDFVSFDPRIPSKRSIPFSFKSKAQIVGSCNGLLLCEIPCHDGRFKDYVYNPLISKFKMLPPKHDLCYEMNGTEDMKIAFDPTKSPFYKVVHVGSVGYDDDFYDDDYDYDYDYSIRIQTYSSQTGVWSVWDDPFPRLSLNGFNGGIYWNGAIHWINYSEPFHVKLDIVYRPVLTIIQNHVLLTILGKVGLDCDRKLFKSHDSLLLFCKNCNDHSRHYIYEMKNGYSVWLVKYFFNLDDIMRPYPTWRIPADWACRHMLSIVLGEHDEDSFMVINLSGKIIQYKFASGTLSEVLDLGKAVHIGRCFEYIASFAHV